MELGRDGTLYGTFESRLCLFPLGRPVTRKACKTKNKKKIKNKTIVLDLLGVVWTAILRA